jgi:hypothetical protein
MEIRKSIVSVEEVVTDGGKPLAFPIHRATAVVVVKNPFAGRFVDDLSPLFDVGFEIGAMFTKRLIDLLGGPPVSYGKAAIVGTAGEMAHGGAVCHPKLGKPMREAVGGGEALISSNVKVASAGASIDVPLGHKDNAWSFDHFDTLTIAVPDAPRPDEIVVVVAVADGGRPHPRVGKGRAVV